jgi:hypothetical protein
MFSIFVEEMFEKKVSKQKVRSYAKLGAAMWKTQGLENVNKPQT